MSELKSCDAIIESFRGTRTISNIIKFFGHLRLTFYNNARHHADVERRQIRLKIEKNETSKTNRKMNFWRSSDPN